MNEITKDKIELVEKFLEELEPNIPETLEGYEENFKAKAICERYFEKVVEALTDIAFLIIKDKNLKIPKEDGQAFLILAENNILDRELAKKLKDAKGMRNVLAHEYGSINDELVFNSIKEELINDAREFIDAVKK